MDDERVSLAGGGLVGEVGQPDGGGVALEGEVARGGVEEAAVQDAGLGFGAGVAGLLERVEGAGFCLPWMSR